MSRFRAKLWKVDEAKRHVAAAHLLNKKVVFTNGCFDILHRGHVTYLEEASKLGDILILGLNSDRSVKAQGKGEERPINNEDDRATVISALASVDGIIIFDGDTPADLIEDLKPDVLVKGGDYDPDEEDPGSSKYVVGRDTVLKQNGDVVCIPLVPGHSTTNILRRITK